MPLTRGELKALIKECLVEILSEGLGGNLQEAVARPRRVSGVQGTVREGKTNGRANGHRRQPDFDPRLDSPINHPGIKQQIQANAGGNPVMAAILADTAATTLQTLANDRALGATSMDGGASGGGAVAGGSSPVALQEHIGDPEEVFGEETMGRWADLAFMAPKKPA